MKKLLLSALALLLGQLAYTQETIIWGAEVIDITSEYSPLEYSALQALHKPNVLPNGGDNPNAWRAKTPDSEDFVMVAFDKPIKAKQVAIAESENPGAVKQVYAYDKEYNEYLLFELVPRAIPLDSRLLNLFFEPTTYEIYAIRVVIDGEAVEGYNAIDAIGISSSNLPISVLMNLAPGVAQDKEADMLGENVNSPYIEHSPIISPDGKHLYFSRRYHPDNVGGTDDVEDIWVSDLDEATGEWLPAKNLGPPLNTAGPNFISSITPSPDGGELLVLGNRYGKKGRMFSGVSMAKRNGDSFSKPEDIEIEDEYNYSPKVDYFLTPKGDAMIMSMERDDSYGKRDLYVSFKNGKTWSAPRNLGAPLNTMTDDYAPFIGKDGKTLYYSSSGFSGYGGADIYVSIRLDDSWKRWSEPENMGSSVNSKEDDQYFSVPSTGKHVYFARGDTDDDTDIFRFEANDLFIDKESPLMASVGHLTPEEDKTAPVIAAAVPPVAKVEEEEYMATIKGVVLDKNTNKPVPNVPVTIERLPDGMGVGQVTTNEEGVYEMTVRAGASYGLHADYPDYISSDRNFDFNALTSNDTLDVPLFLNKIEKGASVVMNNIFFDLEKAVLKTSSYAELNRILKYLQDGEIEKIQISGHTDSTGDDSYNQSLSEKRARAVYEFFVDNGIAKDRLQAIGYGETKPMLSNDTRENRQKNRRVEFQVVE